ncbi:3-hydroxyacyl-CoA dehydrogenase/enoyl-CoA hydratase family protein [Amphritea opalescens]|uniref:3-hydroxyacyl-CoA dehydrogenase/enoyl-CoA hydratase family protein n=1 Tax=Amphritea opalescens TaxID=2490544 RepID=A0A430KPQ4_9GAMM|nr:3-hydroxyacyl-CoA dehydrogenase/enoyl-CoA hydratase family protein [Amphritea opalescens]RTE65323.1 3-hydroxyacyl-CoA dehydrogenase/enoyl-CoA hydratase family protein [Amphritea opalescens]
MKPTVNIEPLAEIKKVAVIGAGVMGAGIAAQAANGGAEVLLLDMASVNGDEDRSRIAQDAVNRLLKGGCAGGLMHPSVAERIQVGNIDDDLHLLSDYDWIIEVIVERLSVKQALFHRIAEVRRDDAIVSSNTSTIPLMTLVDGLPDDFRQHFVITHYFNPPRYMRLVEVIKGPDTLTEVVDRVCQFNDQCMGKTVIHCADRPGFIGNRLGVFWLQVALQEAIKLNLRVEEADAIMKVCGFPSTGIFGLWDLVGIDLMPSVTQSLGDLLPDGDDFAPYAQTVQTVQGMIDKGYYGRKGATREGFYRQVKDANGGRVKEAIDLESFEYRAVQKTLLASARLKPGQLAELIACSDKGGQYAWRVLSQVLHYATKLIPDVATDVTAFDQAMKLGYNWSWGPFEMIDQLGTQAFIDRLTAEGIQPSAFLQAVDQRPIYNDQDLQRVTLNERGEYQRVKTAEGILSLADIKRRPALQQYSKLSLWDLADDVWCVEFTGKVPVLSNELLDQISATLEQAVGKQKALVFYNEGPIFAAGADLKEFLSFIDQPDVLKAYIDKGQAVFHALQTAPVPIVGALSGKALGGGLELLLHCHGIQAHAESAVGLVENQVGIVPGWGGCKEMLLRSAERFGVDAAMAHCFDLIRNSKVTGSAEEAKQLGFLRSTDGISMNLDRLLFDAKQRALRLRPILPLETKEPQPLSPAQDMMLSTEGYQATLDTALLTLLSQATSAHWYQHFYPLERETNQALCQIPEAKARMVQLLETGRALQN